MAPYDDWNKVEEDDEEELQDMLLLETKKDVILFCIDCSPSMLEPREDPDDEDMPMKCHLSVALDAAMQIQKKKMISGPNDSTGILLFNTALKPQATNEQPAGLKDGMYLYQSISPLDVSKVREIQSLLDAATEDLDELKKVLPPMVGKTVAMGDVFTTCNWVFRDGAPKTASKRVFLITDRDDPQLVKGRQLITSARTNLRDMMNAGITIEPFFISTEEKPFDMSKFYNAVLQPNTFAENEDDDNERDPSVLPEAISISRIEELLAQMRIHEVPKRAQFSIPFQIAPGLTIGVKGFGLVTQHNKGAYKYFHDLGDRMEVANAKTVYVDEDRQAEVKRSNVLYGMAVGGAGEDDENPTSSTRAVKAGQRPFYTAEELRSLRTLGMEPSIKLLGFKDQSSLAFEDNTKHSVFIYPDDFTYSGSKRTFAALLKSMVKKEKVGLVLALTRRNSSPTFFALLPQQEKLDESGWMEEPGGFHLVPLPFADDIRAAKYEEGFTASQELEDAALAWISKLSLKGSGYQPDSYPNPALAYHNGQLEASAFQEEFDKDDFENLTDPNVKNIHKRAGELMRKWKEALENDESASVVAVAAAGSKRKADTSVDEEEIRSRYNSGQLAKLRVDQLKEFLKNKKQSTAGKKADLMDRVSEWFDKN
ncbi:Ku DNA-binding complex Ku70 subunit [Dendrothele bispora CBS 962.96]|uniref:ATP-dependent DNA helicase II subunit 1 n=1 Tax=Dendrothele bispora (strain CBS 962.96) TaxID=1314807 RepID=A0A4S8M918_DENBC|nr:Ku DNA-binding complex Ku70 subunit [Dendrothele bispora CBS 962.96]